MVKTDLPGREHDFAQPTNNCGRDLGSQACPRVRTLAAEMALWP